MAAFFKDLKGKSQAYWIRKAAKDKQRQQMRKYAPLIYIRDGHVCQLCGFKDKSGLKLSLDHIKALSRGGLNCCDNLQTLCKDCNSRKDSQKKPVFKAWLKQRRLQVACAPFKDILAALA